MPPTHTTEGLVAAVQIRDIYPRLGGAPLSTMSSRATRRSCSRVTCHASATCSRSGCSTLPSSWMHLTALRPVSWCSIPRSSAGLSSVRRERDPLAELTDPEREVFAALGEGFEPRNRRPARHLRTHRRTHVNQIFGKLGRRDARCPPARDGGADAASTV